MAYRPIAVLDVPSTLEVPALRARTKLWREHHARLEASGALRDFHRRLGREWAIETGLIERLYVWDRGTTELLITQGIDSAILRGKGYDPAQADGIKALIDDQEGVLQGLFDFVRSTRGLTESYIRELHAALTRSQQTVFARTPDGRGIDVPLLRGQYKRRPNNPTRSDGTTHEYCPPEQTSGEMERLVSWYGQLAQAPPEVTAAWLHHAFTQIHPFQDGNGRVARTLTTLVFVKAGLFPLVIRNDDRARYLDALEAADGGALRPLVALFAERQLEACEAALTEADPDTRRAAQALVREAAVDALRRRGESSPGSRAAWEEAQARMATIEGRLQEEVRNITTALRGLRGANSNWRIQVWPRRSLSDFSACEQAVDRFLSAAALVRTPDRRASAVAMKADTASRFTAWFVSCGVHDIQGEGVAMLAWYDDGDNPWGRPHDLGLRPFVVREGDEADAVAERFGSWLEEALLLTLEAWRRGLASGDTQAQR